MKILISATFNISKWSENQHNPMNDKKNKMRRV